MINDTNILKKFIPLLAKVVDGENLTIEESRYAFETILRHDADGYHYTSFISAIHAKGETADELMGFIRVMQKALTPLATKIDENRIIDVSGTGGGAFKTLNVSTTVSFVVAAAGYAVGKAAYHGVTSPTGSADAFQAFGVDITKLNKKLVEETISTVGVCPFFLPYLSPGLENASKLAQKVFIEHQVLIRTPFHLATGAFSPYKTNRKLYGCYSKSYLPILAELFKKMGYKKSLVVHGAIGMPELSNVGESVVAEQSNEKIKIYTIRPEDVGITRSSPEEIRSRGREDNIINLLKVLKGTAHRAKTDLIIMNAGAALYALDGADSLARGIEKARDVLLSGKPYEIFTKLIKKVGSTEKLKAWEEKIR